MSPIVICILTLGVVCIPVAFVQSEGVPNVMCAYSTMKGNNSFTFDVTAIPKRCKAIWSGWYYLDTPMSEANLSLISTLTSNSHDVFISVTWSTTKSNIWVDIVRANDTQLFDKYIAPLEKYISDNKICGIILENMSLFNGSYPGYACQVNAFVSKLKADMPTLTVALNVAGFKYDVYGVKEIFDFTLTTAVDLYVVDTTTTGNTCGPNATILYPIEGSDTAVGLKNVCEALPKSGMDQSKLMINVAIIVMVVRADGYQDGIPYAEYCRRTASPSDLYCADSLQAHYDMVTYAKPFFKGIMVGFLDLDDYDGSCECTEKFPVTNTYLDAWESKPMTGCDNIVGCTN